MLELTDAWKAAFPDAHAGLLVLRDVTNPSQDAELEKQKARLENELRQKFEGADRESLASQSVLAAYASYYRRFKKTYHVQLQLESIVHRNKSIPSVAALVEAMFMAEMKGLLLTAGHDLDQIQLPIRLDVAKGDETYRLLRGQEQTPQTGDMLMRDEAGIISSILYGPDQRTQIRADTARAAFAVYAPAGIEPQAIKDHLENILQNIVIFSPQAKIELLRVFGALD
jgi:DNA/RNA-binding domain of Phe-tRNA-synthetase-like protein